MWTLNSPSRVENVSPVHGMLCRRNHPQRVDIVAIRITAFSADDRLETDVRPASSGMNATDRHEVLSRTLRWDSPNSRAISHELLRGSRSTAVIMASSLAAVRAVRGRPAFTRAVGVTLHCLMEQLL